MPAPIPSATVIRFGNYDVDPVNAELRKHGVRLHIQDQPLQVLTALLNRPGELVTREELRAILWPEGTFVDYERGLNAAVARLRQVLNDSAERPRYVETVARRGYRFIAPTEVLTNAPSLRPVHNGNSNSLSAVDTRQGVEKPAPGRSHSVRAILVAASLLILAVGAYVVWLSSQSVAPLQVTGYTQLTRDNRSKAFTINALPVLVSDGSRVYFTEAGDGPARSILHQISVSGGDSTPIGTNLQDNVDIGDISPDHLRISLQSFGVATPEMPLWTVPVTGGVAVGLSGLRGRDVTWSRDGRRIAFAKATELFVASGDGQDQKRIVSADGPVRWPRWAPDGRSIRYSVGHPLAAITIDEVDAQTGKVKPVLPRSTGACCCGNWTPDGNHYVFECHGLHRTDLWAVREKRPLPGHQAEPVQLTRGPLDFRSATPDPNARRLYALGIQKRGELVRYDEGSRQFVPYLGGISAEGFASSSDGRWVAWASYPEGVLWRAKADGSQKLQLTTGAMRVGLPSWSPDGKRIAFMAQVENQPWAVYLVSADGGVAERVLKEERHQADPSWSPDGKSLAFGRLHWLEQKDAVAGVTVLTADGKNPRLLPGSEQMTSPHWSPDGRYMQAFTPTGSIALFNFQTQRWQDVGGAPAAYPNWSRDGKSIYFSQPYAGRPRLARLRVDSRVVEILTEVNSQHLGWAMVGKWAGLTPDESPLVLRDTGIQEIYALDLP